MTDPLWINASAGAPAHNANELRQAMGLALMYNGRNMGGKQGVRPGGNQLFVSLSVSTITIQPGLAAVDPALSTPQGTYWVALPIAETQTLAPADATNPRKDIVILRVYDHDEDASGLRLARSEYLVGTPAPSPVEPAVPAGSIKLALIDVPASPGTPVVTDRRTYTVAPGGILPVNSAGEFAAAVEGRYRDRLDTNLLERDTGAVWETIADPAMFKAWQPYTPVWTGPTAPVPSIGNGSLNGWHRQVGKTVDIRIVLTWGTTTTAGPGSWRFSLPVGVKLDSLFNLMCHDNSTSGRFSGVVFTINTSATGDNMRIIPDNNPGGASITVPFTWAVGDKMVIHGTVEAA